MGLVPELLSAVEKMGFEEATPIQEKTIIPALEGNDVLGQAQTGTGKTAAYGLPLLQKIDKSLPHVQALIIAPTRELAIQNGQELYRLGEDKGIRTVTVYGGADIRRQVRQLKNEPNVVVGTPGRLLDLIKRHALQLNYLETLVLDEADEMLNMGFIDDIEAIIRQTPSNRQTLLFSATMPKEVKRIGEQFMTNPVEVKIQAREITAATIDQYYTRCRDNEKFDLLTRFIDVHNPTLAMVFVRTKKRADEVSRGLIERGYPAEGLHGDLNQDQRSSILRAFKNGGIDILVATDVAARGLDISNVTHVYNYDIPQDPESYVHRIGRTGRAGKTGMSITFVATHELDYLRTIENLTQKKISPLRPPTEKEAFRGQMKQSVEQVKDLVSVDNEEGYQKAVSYLVDNYTSEQLATAVLHSLAKDPNEVKVHITPEKPLHRKKWKNRRDNNNYKRSNNKKKKNYGNKQYSHHQKKPNNKGKHSNQSKGFKIH